MSIRYTVTLALLASAARAQQKQRFDINNQPRQWEEGQTGYNNCGTVNSQDSMCQTVHINSVNDFCLWGPPTPGVTIGNSEEYEVAWCTQDGHGTRTIPPGTITGAHYLRTPHYTQITGVGDLTALNIARGDDGGELDPHGATGFGNPRGGLVFANGGTNIAEWTSFVSDSEWCFRICHDAPDAWNWCQHIYDLQGCRWNEPGNYDEGFDSCDGDSTEQPPGIYIVNGQSSTYQQSQGPAPSAHPAGASSNCQRIAALDVPVTQAAAPTTSATSSAQSSSAQSSSVQSSSSSAASSSEVSSSMVSSSSSFSSSMVTSTSSLVSSTVSSTSTSESALTTTVTSTASSSSATSASIANNVAASASASSSKPASGASKTVVSVGGSLAAFGLGIVLFA